MSFLKRKGSDRAPPPPEASDSQEPAKNFPEDYDVPVLKDRRGMATARILGIVCLSQQGVILALVGAIYAMLPLKSVEPFIAKFEKASDVVVALEPVPHTIQGDQALTESQVRHYVVLRNTILASSTEMEHRWAKNGELDLMTAQSEYDRFLSGIGPILGGLRDQTITREVEITNVNKLTDRIYQVEFNAVERKNEKVVVHEQTFVATLEVTRSMRKLPWELRLINPTGFTVLNYTVSEKVSQ